MRGAGGLPAEIEGRRTGARAPGRRERWWQRGWGIRWETTWPSPRQRRAITDDTAWPRCLALLVRAHRPHHQPHLSAVGIGQALRARLVISLMASPASEPRRPPLAAVGRGGACPGGRRTPRPPLLPARLGRALVITSGCGPPPCRQPRGWSRSGGARSGGSWPTTTLGAGAAGG